jgi:acetyl esterase/lipase
MCSTRCFVSVSLPPDHPVSQQFLCTAEFHPLIANSREPNTIVIAGDSAGGGLCLALLLILRDQGLPLPAGASLISPWLDLTHSFPSITMPTEWDYVPAHGFHSKPSISWPPPTTDELRALNLPINPHSDPDLELEIDGQNVVLKDQFQMYVPNMWAQIPLVSGILAASLGGMLSLSRSIFPVSKALLTQGP